MHSRVAIAASGLLGLGALAAFARATPHQVFYGDVAEFQLLGLTGGLAHANGYPVYITLANLFALLPIGPLSEAAYRVNLLSAVFGGVAVGLAALFVADVTSADLLARQRWIGVVAGIFAGLSFCLVGTTWALATVASPYTLDTATMLAVLLLVGRWSRGASARYLDAGLFIWGVSFGGHDDTVLLAPGLAFLILTRLIPERRKVVGAVPVAALWLFGGFAVFLATWAFQDSRNVPFDFMHTLGWIAPDTWIPSMRTPLDRFLFQATNQEWRHAFFALPLAQIEANVAGYFGNLPITFTLVGVELAAVGVVSALLRRPALGMALLLTFLAQMAFWMSYEIADLPKHLLPSYLLVALWVGLGAGEVVRLAVGTVEKLSERIAGRAVAGAAVGVVVAAALAWGSLVPLAEAYGPDATGQAPVDYEAIQDHVPASLGEAQAYAEGTVARLPRNAVVFAAWKQVFTLEYVAEFQEGRPDILVTREDSYANVSAVLAYSVGRPDFFVDPPARWLPPDLASRLVSVPPMYELKPS